VAYELWRAVMDRSPNRYLREMAKSQMELILRALRQGRRELAIKRLGVPQVVVGGRP